MACLEGVATDWDSSRDVRKLVQKGQVLFEPLEGDNDIHITVKTASHNYEVLAPLVLRLKNEQNEICMHKVSQIQVESPSCSRHTWYSRRPL